MDKSMIREALVTASQNGHSRTPWKEGYMHKPEICGACMAIAALAELDKSGEGEVSGTGMVEAGNAMKEAIGQIAYELEEGRPLTDDSLCITEAERTVSKWDAALKSTNTPERRPGECDYRKRECVNDGKTVNGVWVCNNHLSNTPQAVTVEGIMELVDDCIDMRDGDGSCVVWPVLDEDQLRTRLDQYLKNR